MCYLLTLVSPLTLSEIRSMLPAGVTADLVPAEQRPGRLALLSGAATAAHLAVGLCACGLVDPGRPDADAERAIRQQYQGRRDTRERVLAAVARHRAGQALRAAGTAPPGALGSFVVEHARNAGASVYFLHPPGGDRLEGDPVPVAPPDPTVPPLTWLLPGSPVKVG